MNVTPISDDFGMMPEVSVIHDVVAFDRPFTGETYIPDYQQCVLHRIYIIEPDSFQYNEGMGS